MRVLDIRRHTMRRKPGAHLSREGIALARLVGEDAQPYDLVVTSTIPRAVETAIAMGFEVDRCVEELGLLPDAVHAEVGWPRPFTHIADAVAAGGPAARFAEEQARLWQDIAGQVPEGGRALIVSHGLFVELGAVATLPDADHAAWGEAIGYCEGIRVDYDGDRRGGALLRLPEGRRLIEN
jgi:broad specificity phosphatase PhoE